MSIITINDKEYETNDFTEQQTAILNEVVYADTEVKRLDYITKTLNERLKLLTQSLSNSLEEVSDDQTDTKQ
jgi:hypothetical protein